jgi:hypothetical protein
VLHDNARAVALLALVSAAVYCSPQSPNVLRNPLSARAFSSQLHRINQRVEEENRRGRHSGRRAAR